MKTISRYLVNLLISLDQFLNSVLAGDPDETISSRIGRIKLKWGGVIPRWRVFTRITDRILDRIDPGHSLDAIEEDEGFDGLCDKPEGDSDE